MVLMWEIRQMINKNFILGGKAIFTLDLNEEYAFSNDLKDHYTFKVNKKLNPDNERYPVTYFVSLLTGPDNTSSYTYLGLLDPSTGSIRTTAKSCASGDSLMVRLLNRTLNLVWNESTEAITTAGFDLHHEGRCGRCGRVLTVPESILSGFGPECAGKAA